MYLKIHSIVCIASTAAVDARLSEARLSARSIIRHHPETYKFFSDFPKNPKYFVSLLLENKKVHKTKQNATPSHGDVTNLAHFRNTADYLSIYFIFNLS